MAGRTWIIFQCFHDNSIVVSKLEGNLATGVAECPDMQTAEAVLEAMRKRDSDRQDATVNGTDNGEQLT